MSNTPIIYLDVDGVLNMWDTRERSPKGFIGIDDKCVHLLKQICDTAGAKIAITSTWKDSWQNEDDPDGIYMRAKFAKHKIPVLRCVNYDGAKRGTGIKEDIAAHNVEHWVVLDDDIFPDYDNDIIKHLVRTSMAERSLDETRRDEAIRILNDE